MSNKKIICINGDTSKSYSQVIFIMKNGAHNLEPKSQVDFIKEAEKIINGISEEELDTKKQKGAEVNIKENEGIQQVIIKSKSNLDVILDLAMLIGCVFMAVTLIYVYK